MNDDLVTRLRYAADRARGEYPEVFRVSEEIAYEAADRIEELQSKVDTVRLAAKYAAKIRDDRIEKLEAALRWIVEQERQTAHPTVCAIVKIARKALNAE
jgi:hypothetical protein